MQRDDFRADIEPSRGQYRAIALAALHLLGLPAPESRVDATETLVRLQRSSREDAAAVEAGSSAGS